MGNTAQSILTCCITKSSRKEENSAPSLSPTLSEVDRVSQIIRRHTQRQALRKKNYDGGNGPAKVLPITEFKQQQKEENCPICADQFADSDQIQFLTCFHKFHCECIGKWFEVEDTCPYCKERQPLDLEENSEYLL